MEKTFTLFDLQHYLQEIAAMEKQGNSHREMPAGPSKMTLRNLINYSRALDVLKTNAAGTFFQLAN